MLGKRILPFLGIFLIGVTTLSCSSTQRQGLEAQLLPKRGLRVTADGVQVVRGSSLKFSSTDLSRNFYDFSWIFQPIEPNPKATVLRLGGPKSFVNGSYRMHQQGNTLKFQVEGKWQRSDSARLTIQAAMLWLPAFADGKVYFDGETEPSLQLDAEGFPVKAFKTRSFKALRLQGKHGSITVQFNEKEGLAKFPVRIADPSKVWDNAPPLLDISTATSLIAPGSDFDKAFSLTLDSVAKPSNQNAGILEVSPVFTDIAREVFTTPLTALPAPKWSTMDTAKTIFLQPANRPAATLFETLLSEAISRLWDVPLSGYENIYAQSTPKTLPAEGFYINSRSGKVQVGYADSAGLRHAAYALAFMARPTDGKLGIPEGTLTDYPSTSWRGIHMFVGPQSLGLHQQMYENVLLPWRMNKVVLQCEQTDWTSQPKIKNPITMSLADLEAEAAFLKRHQVELIPLIQSFGHMEWFFEHAQNLDIATNPEIPYTLDIENTRAQEALKAIWEEAIKATGAKTMHFGLDEVDMIGWAKKEPERITRLWQKHLPFLSNLAQTHGARMMLWGDMLLAPEETIDFGNAESVQEAQKRRAAVPEGALIADWHYKPEADPQPYRASFDALQSANLVPIASTWFYPENIRGFNLAAVQRKLGTLQTTWADFESSEANMLKYLPQFGAYLLSLDYAWSGRKELPSELPYDPNTLWASLFYRKPEPIRPTPGYFIAAQDARPISCGPLKFLSLEGQGAAGERAFSLKNPVEASGLSILMETGSWSEENETLGLITLHFKNGTTTQISLRYGVHARVSSDPRPVLAGFKNNSGQSAVFLPFEAPGEVAKIIFIPSNPYGTTTVAGLTLIQAQK